MTRMITSDELDAIARTGIGPTAEEHAAWHAWLRREGETESLPQAVHDKLFAKAWDHGHASGYYEVQYFYTDLAELALAAYAAGRRDG